MRVFGAGVGRTGTLSMRMALEHIGFGPCHHMKVVLENQPHHVPLWNQALSGNPDWQAIYQGMMAAVDWPTASFYRELHAAYPEAKFILTHRDPETWTDSFSETIYKAIQCRDQAPPEAHPWLDMCINVIERAGFPIGLSRDELTARFIKHNKSVIEAISASHLLVTRVKDGWDPICEFLSVSKPDIDFPRSNDREEFWKIVDEGTHNQ